MKRQAAIVGTGLVSGLGCGVETHFNQMLSGRVGIRPITRFPSEPYAQQNAGQLADADERRLLARYADDDLTWGLILAAAEEAMGGIPGQVDHDLGLVLATNFGVMETLCWCWQERLDTGEMDEATFRRQQDVVETVARHLGVGGPRLQLSLSCASGAAAIEVALEWLRSGRASRVLAIGYDVLSEFIWCGLSNLRTITPDAIRPFNHERQGTIFSEGAAAMLLSVRDDDPAQGWVLGSATTNNAFHMTAPAKDADGSRRAMQAALQDAGVEPAAVDFVCAHATGTQANDVTESAAINNLLQRRVPVAAFKSNLGHLLGAAGLAEAIISLQALRSGSIPPIQGIEVQDEACDIEVVRDAPRSGDYRLAITNSAGIGGNNSSIVMAREPGDSSAPAPAPRRVAIERWGWVLPDHVGSGDLPLNLDTAVLLAANPTLEGFSAKSYLSSVKGYLDAAGQQTLAAAALALDGRVSHDDAHERFAVVSVTQYGAPASGYRFYELMQSKGPRLASPLIFPHSYANTAPNLVAIEFNLGGEHMVINNATDVSEAWLWAQHLVRSGKADDVLFLACEAISPHLLPDNYCVLNGALACWLRATTEDAASLPAIPAVAGNRYGTIWSALKALQKT